MAKLDDRMDHLSNKMDLVTNEVSEMKSVLHNIEKTITQKQNDGSENVNCSAVAVPGQQQLEQPMQQQLRHPQYQEGGVVVVQRQHQQQQPPPYRQQQQQPRYSEKDPDREPYWQTSSEDWHSRELSWVNDPADGGQERHHNQGKPKSNDCIPARWITAILGCIGFIVVYGLKVNLSVAIVAMVNHTAVEELGSGGHHGDDHHGSSNETHEEVDKCAVEGAEKKAPPDNGPFVWDENIQGIVLAAYFYGYIVTQVPGGAVAEKFSAKHVFGTGAILNIAGTLLFPLASRLHYVAAIICRIVMGIAGGVTLPGMHVLIANWAPPTERSVLASTIYAGMTLGTLLCMPFSGMLASFVSWEAIFYVQGGLSLIWYVLWWIFVFDSPSVHPRINPEERDYIVNAISGGQKVSKEKPKMPWASAFKSKHVWAIIAAHTCCNWGWYMLLVKLPTYMRYILKFDMKSNAGLSAVPFLCMWIFTVINAKTLDTLIGKGVITTTVARKISSFTATVPPACCLIAVTFVGCNTDLAVVLLCIGTTLVGGMYSGFLSNHIDLAPPFAGTLMGISNTFATLPGIIMPSFIGWMTHGNQTIEAWRTIFILTLCIASFGAISFLIFGSGELQPWAKPKQQKDNEDKYSDDA